MGSQVKLIIFFFRVIIILTRAVSLGSLLQVKIVFIYVNFDNLSSVGVSRCPISLNGGIFVFS